MTILISLSVLAVCPFLAFLVSVGRANMLKYIALHLYKIAINIQEKQDKGRKDLDEKWIRQLEMN
jgi:hypothetical protein